MKVSLSALSFKFFVCASGVENSFGVLLFGMKCFMFTFGCGSVMLARKNKFFLL